MYLFFVFCCCFIFTSMSDVSRSTRWKRCGRHVQRCRGVYHFHPSLPWYLIHVLNSDVGGLDPLGHGVAADLVGDTFHGRLQARVGVVRLD